MYRVVIIDDEAVIVEGLRRVVDWAAYGCEVAAVACSAEEGAAVIRESRPDILFTDIRMPDGDGLAMLAGVKSEFPALQVTVLTGYRDFEYAQQAVRLGVTRLLLKPSKMDEINEALAAMTERLSAGRGGEPAETEPASGSFIIRQATAYIEENYASKLTLRDVADHCYVSQWHLSKLLNKYAGGCFYDLLNATRVREAKRLLADPALRIGDICERVGYNDPAHFARVFRRLTGMSANEYRNSGRSRAAD